MYTRFGQLILPFVAVMWIIMPTHSAWSAGWEMVFSDEFNGDTLDKNKWATRYIYQNETMDHFNDENQRYRDSQIKLSGGVLNLTAQKNEGSDSYGLGGSGRQPTSRYHRSDPRSSDW